MVKKREPTVDLGENEDPVVEDESENTPDDPVAEDEPENTPDDPVVEDEPVIVDDPPVKKKGRGRPKKAKSTPARSVARDDPESKAKREAIKSADPEERKEVAKGIVKENSEKKRQINLRRLYGCVKS